MPAEVACLDISVSVDDRKSNVCAVGLWDISTRIVKLDDLSFLHSEMLGGGERVFGH